MRRVRDHRVLGVGTPITRRSRGSSAGTSGRWASCSARCSSCVIAGSGEPGRLDDGTRIAAMRAWRLYYEFDRIAREILAETRATMKAEDEAQPADRRRWRLLASGEKSSHRAKALASCARAGARRLPDRRRCPRLRAWLLMGPWRRSCRTAAPPGSNVIGARTTPPAGRGGGRGLRVDRFAAADLLREVISERLGAGSSRGGRSEARAGIRRSAAFRSEHDEAEIDHLWVARSRPTSTSPRPTAVLRSS